VFQNYNLIPNLTIYDNIVLPVELDGRSADAQYLEDIVKALGLEGLLGRKPGKLSGGQQQRAAIARALVSKPAIILADEPTGNLDSRTSQEVMGLLCATGKKFHQTIVMITHNDEIAQIADRTVRIEDGRIVEGR
jgi:putative ABC transport system ATP-binding protein